MSCIEDEDEEEDKDEDYMNRLDDFITRKLYCIVL